LAEETLFSQIWLFLSPGNDEFIVKELLYDFSAILLDKSTDLASRIKDMNRLQRCIESATSLKIKTDWSAKQFVNEFDRLSHNQKVYAEKGKSTKALEDSRIELTFTPNINKTSDCIDISAHCEELYNHYQEKEEKILCSKLTALEEELNECTFAPKVLSYRNGSVPAKFMKTKSDSIDRKTTAQSSLEKELQECTFTPQIHGVFVDSFTEKPRGYQEFVGKYRKAAQDKNEIKQREKEGYGENYERNRRRKPNPPSHLYREKEIKPILVYIDVNVAPGKRGKIALRERDDPRQVAESFCRIYSLGKDYEDNLEGKLRRHLDQLIYS
jgi:hypothetical protein